MINFEVMTPEERFKFGGWVYYISEGWNNPNWCDKNKGLAEATGHVMEVNFIE